MPATPPCSWPTAKRRGGNSAGSRASRTLEPSWNIRGGWEEEKHGTKGQNAMRDIKRLLGNMASLFTLQGANYLLPLVTLPYLVRVLGTEKFGLIAFAQAFIQYFVIITDYGFNLSATRDVAINRDDPAKLGEIIVSIMSIKLFLFVAGLVFLLLTMTLTSFGEHWKLYLIIYITVLGNAIFPVWLIQGLEFMKQLAWISILARAITTIAIFIFVHNPADYLIAATIQSTSLVIAAVPGWMLLIMSRRFLLTRTTVSDIKGYLYSGWHVFLSTVAANIYANSNIFVLGLVSGPIAVGYFSAANKIAQAVQGLFLPISQTIYPHISGLVEKSQEDAISFIRKVLRYVGVVSLVVSSVLFWEAELVVNTVLGAQYGSSVIILKWLAFLPFLITVNNMHGSQTMLTFKMNKMFSKIVMVSALVNIVLVIPLTNMFSGEGAAMSMLFTELFLLLTMSIVLYRRGINLYFRPVKA